MHTLRSLFRCKYCLHFFQFMQKWLQLDWTSNTSRQKINFPAHQKGYDNSETTIGKLLARRIQIYPDYFCLGIILKVILNDLTKLRSFEVEYANTVKRHNVTSSWFIRFKSANIQSSRHSFSRFYCHIVISVHVFFQLRKGSRVHPATCSPNLVYPCFLWFFYPDWYS